MSEFTAPSGAGVFVTPKNSPRQLQVATFAQDFLLPAFNGDFPNGTPAVIAPDAVNPGIIAAAFAVFFAPIGVYWSAYVPVWATRMRVQLISRSVSGVGLPANLGLTFYNRSVANNAAVNAWNGIILADISFPTTQPQYSVVAPIAGETFADWSMVVGPVPPASSEGTMYQFIVERNVAPAVPPNLAGDWNLFGVMQTFSA